jgi:hypothetical protein
MKSAIRVFEGIRIEGCIEPAFLLKKMFVNIRNIEVKYVLDYTLEYRKIPILHADGSVIQLTPGMFIHRNRDVFRTYNYVLHHMIKGRFLKRIKSTWVLCSE